MSRVKLAVNYQLALWGELNASLEFAIKHV